MEEEILQEMINDRNVSIKVIQTKMELQTRKIDRLQSDLSKIRDEYSKEHVQNTMSLEDSSKHYKKALQTLKERLEQLDMKKQQSGSQLELYNDIMKAVLSSVENGDSSYVLRMQAQLCKAMHSMGMMEAQLAMIQNFAAERQKYLKDSITLNIEEKSQAELLLMNDLIAGGDALRTVEEKHKAMIDNFTSQKDALLDKIEKQQEKEEEDEEAEDEDEDDEEEKEELKEILSQGREEMERMEKENQEEREQLEKLKAQVAAIQGEPFVEELVATIAEEFKDEEEEEDED